MKQLFFIISFVAFSFMLNATAPFPQGFENLTEPKGEYFDANANFAAIELADNPLKAGINTSDKVAAVSVGGNSGIIKIKFANNPFEYPKHPEGLDELFYDVLRFKYYSAGKLNKNVEFEPNGSATNPKTIVQPGPYYYEEWAYVTLPLEWKSYTDFQIRVNRNAAGNGAAEGTVAGDLVYLDDFEVYNSILGPVSSVQKLTIENVLVCKDLGGGNYSADIFMNALSSVRVDLISLDGRSTTLYNQVAEGTIQVPFTLQHKGIYCVRVLVDGKYSVSDKIMFK